MKNERFGLKFASSAFLICLWAGPPKFMQNHQKRNFSRSLEFSFRPQAKIICMVSNWDKYNSGLLPRFQSDNVPKSRVVKTSDWSRTQLSCDQLDILHEFIESYTTNWDEGVLLGSQDFARNQALLGKPLQIENREMCTCSCRSCCSWFIVEIVNMLAVPLFYDPMRWLETA